MKKVVILGFGGTIAMVPDQYGTLALATSIEELIKFVPQLSSLADIEVVQLENCDSTNINPSH